MNLTADMNQAQADFNKVMAGYVDRVGMPAPFVVKDQAGKLLKTLIQITPPKDRAKTVESIERRIRSRFENAGRNNTHFAKTEPGGKAGKGDVRWYAWRSNALYGATREFDATQKTPDEIYKLSFKLTNAGRFRAGKRGKQTVYISRKTLVTQKQLKAAIEIGKKHIFRLKAAWLPAWRKLGAPFAVPQRIQKHEAGAKGYAVDGTGNKDFPTFSMANAGTGVQNLTRQQGYLLKRAFQIRAKAMAKDISLYIKGVKKWPPTPSQDE